MVAHLGDVHQTVLVDSDVDKCAKVHNVPDGALENHARLQILHIHDIRSEDRFRHIRAGIPSRLLQLLRDISECLFSDTELLRQLSDSALRADAAVKIADLTLLDVLLGIAEFLQQPGCRLIGLRMYPGYVERILTAPDPQEACALLEGLRTEPGYLQELLSVLELPVLLPVADNRLCRLFGDAGHVQQQRPGCCVQVDANLIDTVLDHAFQFPTQLFLITVMLVLADSDRLRVNLDELRQWILKPSRDGGRTPLSDIERGKFLRRQLACRVHRRPCLADNRIVHLLRHLRDDLRDNLLRLPGGGSISTGYERHMIF